MKRKIYIAILIVFTSLCASAQKNFTGYYKCAPLTFKNKLINSFRLINNITVGSKLYLDKDSSFKYITCGNILTGDWAIQNDSLLLKFKTNVFRNDSLVKSGARPDNTNGIIRFKIKNQYTLFSIYTDIDKSMSIEKLVKQTKLQ